jgi:hypothetical protein
LLAWLDFCCDWLDNSVEQEGIYLSVLLIGGIVLELIIVIVLLLLLFGSFPTYGYSRNWGYGPSGGLGTILIIVLILWLLHII